MVFNKRNIAAFFLSYLLLITGKIRKIKKRAAKGEFILSVYFHDPDRNLFEACVKWFLKHEFHFLTPDDLIAIASGAKPFPSSAVIFTADDGWRNNKDNIAAVANKYHVPVTIFASTEPVSGGNRFWWSAIYEAHKKDLINKGVQELKKVKNEERMQALKIANASLPAKREALTIEELKEISGTPFVTIGSHTVTHPMLTSCSDGQSFTEISESKKILSGWLNKPVDHFAYPNGDFTQREINFLNDCGYKSAFTTKPQYITPDSFKNLYTLPRFDVLETVSFAENICRMTGAWFNKKALLKFL